MSRRTRAPYRNYRACALCGKPTRSWSRYCQPHARRLKVHGDPRAKPMRMSWLIHYAVQGRLVLDRNIQHRGLQLALQELDELLADAMRRFSDGQKLSPDYCLWLGLAQSNTAPMQILTMLVGAILYEQLAGDSAVSRKAYIHRIARAVVSLDRLKPGGRDLNATGQRLLGEFLLDRYGPLALGVLGAVKTAEQKAHERRALITAPLR